MKILNIISALILVLFMGSDLRAIPPGFNIQGRLTDANGVNKDGAFRIQFSIFPIDTAGTAVWEKTMPSVMVKNGNFQVVLQGGGDIGGQLEDAVKDLDTAYVEIKVGSEPPLVPRQQLLRTPFSPPTINLVGAVMFFAGATCPPGWLLLDGSTLPVIGNETLFSQITYLYGGSGANFVLPNILDGSFIRGRGGNAAAQGMKQMDALQGHTHDYTYPAAATTGTGNAIYMGKSTTSQSWMGLTINHSVKSIPQLYGEVRAGVESRPVNYAMTPCIKH